MDNYNPKPIKQTVTIKMANQNPSLNFSNICELFLNCYPTITNGIYSIENSVLSDQKVFGKTPGWGVRVRASCPSEIPTLKNPQKI